MNIRRREEWIHTLTKTFTSVQRYVSNFGSGLHGFSQANIGTVNSTRIEGSEFQAWKLERQTHDMLFRASHWQVRNISKFSTLLLTAVTIFFKDAKPVWEVVSAH